MTTPNLTALTFLLIVLGGQLPLARGQSADKEGLQTFIDEGFPAIPSRLHIRWQTEEHAVLTREELDSLEAEIADKPDHPRRQEAVNEEWKLTHGPSIRIRDFYTGPDGQWRFGEMLPDGSTTDVCGANGVVWSVTTSKGGEGSALLLEEGTPPPPGRNVLPFHDLAKRQVSQFTRGALSFLIGIPSPQVTSLSPTPTGWKAQVEFLEGAGRFEFRGDVGPAGIQVTDAKLVHLEMAPEQVGTRAACTEPWVDSPLGPVLRVADEFTATGRLKFRNQLLLVEPYDDTAVFAIPKDVWNDDLRGSVTLTSVTDFRSDPDGRLRTRSSSDGEWTTVKAPSTVQQQVLWSLDRVGYLLLAGASLILAGVWALRRRGVL